MKSVKLRYCAGFGGDHCRWMVRGKETRFPAAPWMPTKPKGTWSI